METVFISEEKLRVSLVCVLLSKIEFRFSSSFGCVCENPFENERSSPQKKIFPLVIDNEK